MGVEEQTAESPDVVDIEDGADLDQLETGADSSDAPDDGDRKSILDVVRDAVPADEEDEDPDSPTGEESSDNPSDKDEGSSSEKQPVEPDEENFSDVPFSKHPRFQQLIAQRNQFKQGHEQYEAVQTFLQENGLSGEDAANALRVQALLKRDPHAAWTQLKPIVQDLLVRTGEVLPDDLRAEVRAGRLTQQNALEISRARAMQGVQQNRQQVEQEISQNTQAVSAQRAIQQAAAEWEMGKLRDPKSDFAKISEDVQKEVLWLQKRDGMPKDPAGVRKMLDDAEAAVRKRHKPKQKPGITPVRGGRAAGGNGHAPAPKSVLEIVQRGGA